MSANVIHSSFSISRVLPAPAARVFEAFADPDIKRRWFAEGDQHEVEEFAADLRECATERLRYRFREGTPFAGHAVTNVDTVLNVVPEQRIVWASKMAFGEAVISAALMTAELLPHADGTELVLTFQGAFFEGADGPEIREMGCRVLLERLEAVLRA
ncbi:SRPBCC domain-containing protein [Sphingosinicella sp. BN140058]|uniref:SRPBCC domain-containing protein n=1 Tax=Sphingosinicella sp. BN140058 TaxID=1892855 RepID=UPI001012475A|nr:SRPBCC domain-containing protein [Sphingosinicella sp. BN140058]QAY77584.1 polyketide cyclase [Sphingosinicella sp. BN140058]